MIEWTLELVEWIRTQVWEKWPDAKLRANSPELDPEGYKIRFREDGKQYWLFLDPQVIWNSRVSEVTALMESQAWIPMLKEAGQITVDTQDPDSVVPVLRPWPGRGPEIWVDPHDELPHHA